MEVLVGLLVRALGNVAGRDEVGDPAVNAQVAEQVSVRALPGELAAEGALAVEEEAGELDQVDVVATNLGHGPILVGGLCDRGRDARVRAHGTAPHGLERLGLEDVAQPAARDRQVVERAGVQVREDLPVKSEESARLGDTDYRSRRDGRRAWQRVSTGSRFEKSTLGIS